MFVLKRSVGLNIYFALRKSCNGPELEERRLELPSVPAVMETA